jgi:hypothetical protein
MCYLGDQGGVSSCRDRSRCQSGRLDFLTLTLILISFFHFYLFLFYFSLRFWPCHDEVPASISKRRSLMARGSTSLSCTSMCIPSCYFPF